MAGLQQALRLGEDVREGHHLIAARGIGEGNEGEPIAARGFTDLHGSKRARDPRHAAGPRLASRKLGEGQHLLAFQGPHIVLERVAAQIESNRPVLLTQPLRGQPIVTACQTRRRQVVAAITEQRRLRRAAVIVAGGGIVGQRVDAQQQAVAVGVEAV